jgi:protein ImuB
MPRIVSVWLKAWPIARLLRTQASASSAEPVDFSRPLVLVASAAGGARIVALNRAARQGGLVAGDLVSNARSKVLDLQTREADPAADAAALARLALWSLRYTPTAMAWDEASGGDGLFLDITGCAHLVGGETGLLADLGQRLRAFGLVARLAIADTAGASWALARHGSEEGRIVPSGAEAAALHSLPLDGLRLSAETLALLRRLGFRRIGQVIDQPRAPFAARCAELPARLDQALGRAPEPLVPVAPPPAYRVQAAFMEPIVTGGHVLEAATRLLQELARKLAQDAAGARVLRLLLFRVDGEMRPLDLGLAAPSRDADHIARLIGLRLDRLADDIDADFGFEAAAIHVLTAEPLAERQADLAMGGAAPPPEALPRLVDRLRQRLGPRAVYALEPCASHLPERAVRKAAPSARGLPSRPLGPGYSPAANSGMTGAVHTPSPRHRQPLREREGRGEGRGEGRKPAPIVAPEAAPHPRIKSGAGSDPLPASGERECVASREREGKRSGQGEWGDDILAAPRPLLLLPRPEPADVVALIPEGPPRRFRWRGVLHQVAEAQGPERIAPEWWRRTGEAERDYYLVEDTAGRRFWLYRAGLYGRGDGTAPTWFVHGVFG